MGGWAKAGVIVSKLYERVSVALIATSSWQLALRSGHSNEVQGGSKSLVWLNFQFWWGRL